MKYKYELFLLFLVLMVAIIFFNEQGKETYNTGSVSMAQPKERPLTEEQRKRNQESWESFEQGLMYSKALVIEEAKIKTNANYNSTYYFTVKNTSDDTIIAFKLNGEKFKTRIRPGRSYSGQMKATSDFVSDYKVESIVLESGELINVFN